MPPTIVALRALRSDNPLTAELLKDVRENLNWTRPIEVEPGDRLVLQMVGHDDPHGDVQAAFENAGEAVGVEWTDYFAFVGGAQ